jgi:hypothetical protein
LNGKRLGDRRRSLRQDASQAPQALAERQGKQVGTVEPQKVESHVDEPPCAPDEVEENWPAGFVGRDHLAVQNGIIDGDLGRNIVAELAEAAEGVAAA